MCSTHLKARRQIKSRRVCSSLAASTWTMSPRSLICCTIILNWWLSPNALPSFPCFYVFFYRKPMSTHCWPHPIPIHLNPFHTFLYDMTSQSHPRWNSLEGARACRPWRELEKAGRELSQAMTQWSYCHHHCIHQRHHSCYHPCHRHYNRDWSVILLCSYRPPDQKFWEKM